MRKIIKNEEIDWKKIGRWWKRVEEIGLGNGRNKIKKGENIEKEIVKIRMIFKRWDGGRMRNEDEWEMIEEFVEGFYRKRI